ncbi:MAG: hypothetical protein M5R36_28035 [Deltaproteobacteria bacterium]|nr:hypothetical protein [Deltaproteobacteria bacterium]
MRRRLIGLVIFIGCVGFAAGASAQTVRVPSRGGPALSNVTGFMMLSVGMNGMASFAIEEQNRGGDASTNIRDVEANIPGYGLGAALIPTWGPHGWIIGASYDVVSGKFKQTVDDGTLFHEGETEIGMGLFAFRTGYVHYFGDLEWHPFVLADAGYGIIRARANSKFEDDYSSKDNNQTLLGGVGIGIGKETPSGFFGGQLVADIYPLPYTMGFGDPAGSYEISISHPVVLRLQAFLALGHL